MFERMVEASPDAQSWHRPDDTVEYVSPTWEELFGYRIEDVRGATLARLAHPDDVTVVQAAHDGLRRDGRRFCISYRLRSADGLYVWVESRGGGPTDGDPPGFVVATRDISARRSLVLALETQERLLEREQRIADQQATFLTTIAHASRTPMTKILGFASVLRDRRHELTEERLRDLLDRLVAAAETLSGLIERVTTMRDLGEMRTVSRDGACDLHEVVYRVVEQSAAGDAPIEVAIDEDLAVAVPPDDVERAVALLLSNAITHTPVGTRVWITATPEGTQDVSLTVTDDGPGVPDELKEAVFEPFRSAGSRADYNPGIGLGLSIVARIATNNGGRAWATDRPGGGAAFHLRLPRAPASPTER